MIRIVDYEAGNLTSVKRALDYLGVRSEITPDAEAVAKAERVIFPGVGHAAAAMKTLRARGLDQALHEAFANGIPILGICVGAQIVLSHSQEGDTTCLGFIAGDVPRFDLSDPLLKIPHMGWNEVHITKPHPVLKGMRPGDEFYFVHSYYPKPADESNVYATSEYEITFPSVIGSKNLLATQFHLEKSGRSGLGILKNFVSWDGSLC
ncbi:MAG: imidazole glycerol phosphate synthase subunit HisH [Chitinivibrionales bacterium]|nr:imidazole glycerol phosphate synthase subunit HisH [Chitinivibrionales bacterium]MBD3355790.1 imidazole glycerol phosphate synthase subunit HisH [Chitinivibrionales bacterium]